MKNTFKYLLGTLALAGTMVACSPEEFDHMSEDGIVSAIGYGQQINIQVDQSTNQVTFTLNDAKEIFPVWEIDLGKGKTEISTVNGFKRIFTLSGDYTVRCHIGNRNGISDSYVEEKFHLNNSIVDFTKYTTMLSKAPWYLDNTAAGHLGCGEPGTDGTNWWSAGPDEKAAFGVYDNALTFTADYKYTFDPGASGTIYANKDVTVWPDYRNPDEDYNVPVELQNTTYNFEVDGDDLYLTFPKGTLFPYIANDDIYNTPRYRVLNMTTKTMTLVIDNGSIAWHYILTTQHEVKEIFNGFDVNSEDNLWKQANASFNSLYYAHGGSWDILPDYEHSEENGVYTVILPTATDNQWQAQYCLKTDLTSDIIVPGTKYDFSCKITSSTDLKGVTLKLTSPTDDPSLINNQNGPLAVIPAMEETVVYFTELEAPAIDGNYKFVFDFGGNPDDTQIEIKDIVIIDHSKNKINPPSDDPSDDPEKPVIDWSGENLLAGMPVNLTQYYADANWTPYAEAEYTAENGVYTISYPNANTSQWQAQFTFNNTGIALDPEKTYDFRVKITSSADHPGVTVKLTQQDDDNTFLTEGRHPLAAFEETWIELSDLKITAVGEGKGVITDLKMPFDFGGVAAGTEIVISDMHLQEHKGPKTIAWDLTGEKNLWLKGSHETLSYYYAPGWNQIADPVAGIDGNSYTIYLTEATSDQWQAQWHISTELGAADIQPDKKYNIRFTFFSSKDQPGVTFKLTENGNDSNFLTEGRHACEAWEETVVEIPGVSLSAGALENPTMKLVLDFAGNPADCTVTVKDIIIQVDE